MSRTRNKSFTKTVIYTGAKSHRMLENVVEFSFSGSLVSFPALTHQVYDKRLT